MKTSLSTKHTKSVLRLLDPGDIEAIGRRIAYGNTMEVDWNTLPDDPKIRQDVATAVRNM